MLYKLVSKVFDELVNVRKEIDTVRSEIKAVSGELKTAQSTTELATREIFDFLCSFLCHLPACPRVPRGVLQE